MSFFFEEGAGAEFREGDRCVGFLRGGTPWRGQEPEPHKSERRAISAATGCVLPLRFSRQPRALIRGLVPAHPDHREVVIGRIPVVGGPCNAGRRGRNRASPVVHTGSILCIRYFVHVDLKGREAYVVHRQFIWIAFVESVPHVEARRDLSHGSNPNVAHTLIAIKSLHTICIFLARGVLLSWKLARSTGASRTTHSLVAHEAGQVRITLLIIVIRAWKPFAAHHCEEDERYKNQRK